MVKEHQTWLVMMHKMACMIKHSVHLHLKLMILFLKTDLLFTSLRDRYREILQGIGADNAMSYRTDRLCKRLCI